jgi:hypothetical protein
MRRTQSGDSFAAGFGIGVPFDTMRRDGERLGGNRVIPATARLVPADERHVSARSLTETA